MKFGVVIFPGSNCDQDMIYVLKDLMELDVVELWHKDHDLQKCDVIILPGGFAFGDYLRSGAIARFSPIMESVIKFADRGGLVFGICNGFQVLCEASLLPGALLHNSNQKFICKNVFIKAQTYDALVTSMIEHGQVLKVPIGHGEGSYYADEATLKMLNDKRQILFRYCDAEGNITPESNPNGSIENIAGVCNEGRNVFGMMPHPERASDNELGNMDGKIILESLLNAVLKYQ
jgi:phosphoribosylformylglycinamidine synthase I